MINDVLSHWFFCIETQRKMSVLISEQENAPRKETVDDPTIGLDRQISRPISPNIEEVHEFPDMASDNDDEELPRESSHDDIHHSHGDDTDHDPKPTIELQVQHTSNLDTEKLDKHDVTPITGYDETKL